MTRRSGNSLLEVLVAFAIMAIVLTALIPGQADLLRRSGEASKKALAQDYALSLIDGTGLDERQTPGRQEILWQDWRASIDVSEVTLRDRSFDRIQVQVLDAVGAPLAFAETYRLAR